MKYHLVLQFPGDSRNDLEALLALEDRLIGSLEPEHVVDGHDVGSGEGNIFIHSDNPSAAFELARPRSESRVPRSSRSAVLNVVAAEFSGSLRGKVTANMVLQRSIILPRFARADARR